MEIYLIGIPAKSGLKEEVEIEKIDYKLDLVRDKGFRLDILNAFFGSSA